MKKLLQNPLGFLCLLFTITVLVTLVIRLQIGGIQLSSYATDSNAPVKTAPEQDWFYDGRININTATAEHLMLLGGIGEALAGRIITYRQENGPFGSIDDLKMVDGIGPELFREISQHITVGGQS